MAVTYPKPERIKKKQNFLLAALPLVQVEKRCIAYKDPPAPRWRTFLMHSLLFTLK